MAPSFRKVHWLPGSGRSLVPEVVFIDYETDFALLKVDWDKNRKKDWLQGRDGFPFVKVSKRELEEGEPVARKRLPELAEDQ